jgi:hypothetical protein
MQQQLIRDGNLVKQIPNYPDYFITESGAVWSDKTNKWLKFNMGKMGKGYKRTALGNDKFLVHRLVAITWVENPHNKKTVNHIDGNTLNNYYKNLEWCTQKENIKHSWGIGTTKRNAYHNSNEKNPKAKLTNQQVLEIRASELSSRKLAKIYGINYGSVAEIKRGERYKNI